MLPGRVLLLRNPRARRAPSQPGLHAAAEPLVARGWHVDVASTTGPGEATRIASTAAASGYHAVVAVGGDGTVHEVVQGLAGTSTALGVVPAGTANVWAHEAGASPGARRALAFLARARAAPIDVGRVTSADGTTRRFLLMCSVGLDAEVVRRVGGGGALKRLLGGAVYGATGLAAIARATPTRTAIDVDGQRAERDLYLAIVGNTRLYGGLARITGAALADDGALDVCSFSGHGLRDRCALVARALRGGLDRPAGGGIDYTRGVEVRIEPERPLPVQADGEYIGETPVTITVEPRALTVLLAPEPNPLLSGEVD
ncbi:MAG: diacylglycerol kinase family lipid kinase [Chloroflexi bacterium]|nr:diacylglycerol kinase family lipid kinase [Chloroflexota bacterium]